MNIRNIVLVAAIAVSGAANAQRFVISVVEGGTLEGTTIKLTGSQFKIRVSLDTQGTSVTGATLNTGLAFGVSTGTNTFSGPINFVSGVKLAPDFASATSSFVRRNAPTSAPLNYTTGAGSLPAVIYSSYGNNPAVTLNNNNYGVAEYVFSSTIANNDTWGDSANETGLFLAAQTSTGSAASLGGSGMGNSRFGSVKYSVQAVPEPATMLVLGAGLAALARRRKNA